MPRLRARKKRQKNCGHKHEAFLCLMTRYKKKIYTRITKKISLSVQRSVLEQFSFNGKKIQSVHVNGEECLVSRDIYMAIGCEEENGKKKPFKF